MRDWLNKIKERMGSGSDILDESGQSDYVELGAEAQLEKARVTIRPFIIEDFEHIKPILDALRAGNTIALINIKPLKDRDLVELKRAINKLKKTCDAIEGDIAGFGENWIAASPSFARIHRGPKVKGGQQPSNPDSGSQVTEYSVDE